MVAVFQVYLFIDEFVDRIYSRRDLLQLLDHSGIVSSSLPSMYDGPLSVYCDNLQHSGPHATTVQQCDRSNMQTGRDGGSPSHSTSFRTPQSGAESHATAAPSSCQSQSRSSSVNGFTSQLTVLLVPLSDFLTQHLAMLQTWLSCTSYRQLVVSLCRHIAQVDMAIG